MNKLGLAGRIAALFINSKITPLLSIAVIIIGLMAVMATPREEEPQISVPMVDVFVLFPGATAREVEQRVATPLEQKISEIPGVEYVYTTSQPGMAMAIVRFYVGEDLEKSLVKLYDKLNSNMDMLPVGAMQPMVKPKGIDDVPVLTLTLWSERYGDYEIRQVAERLLEEIRKVPQTSQSFLVGGRKRQLRVILDPARMAGSHIAPLQMVQMIQATNGSLQSGEFQNFNQEFKVSTGSFLRTAEDVQKLVVGSSNGKPVYLGDVARVIDGPEEVNQVVWMGLGPRADEKNILVDGAVKAEYPAVTIAIAKKKGVNAVNVTQAALRKVEALRGNLIPSEIHVTVTRDYGATANEKANELLEHLLIATFSVILLIWVVLGRRSAGVVALAVPITLALSLFTAYILGYTINRVTLFALIFCIGILVDDAIVVVENIHRHFKLRQRPPLEAAVYAVDEVGNPTILATFTVIAALLPMAFVSGLMGPYMSPIPINASIAMFFSLLVAFVVSPWIAHILFKKEAEEDEEGYDLEGSRIYRFYNWLLTPLFASRTRRVAFLGIVVVLLMASMSLFAFKGVIMKMLPFDNKSEIQLVIDMPEGTPLEKTAVVARALGEYVRTIPEVTDYQAYVGTSSPFNFNGLVRHYFLRQGGNVGDIQINLVEKKHRKAQSHAIASRIRPDIDRIASLYGANVKVLEVPPGPPVQSSIVAEIYGPDYDRQIAIARQVRAVFSKTEGVTSIDDYVEDDQTRITFEVDKEKAALNGIPEQSIVQTMRLALSGMSAGLLHLPEERSPVDILLRLPLDKRSSPADLQNLYVQGPVGNMVPLSELVVVNQSFEEKAIYHKNLKRVVYVVADVKGREESPTYAMLKMRDRLNAIPIPEGYTLSQHWSAQPEHEDKFALKWDGEWQVTYEVFRDLGMAFAVAMILIYLLIVGQFQSFLIPVIIMLPIPLTLVGILPGHWVTGSYFTATSMIGFIALSGIIVRNSILLVDFIIRRRQEGAPLETAIIEAGAVRFRPIVLTAAAAMVAAFVIVFDPIFQGLAVSLIFGVLVSTMLTAVVIPVVYYMLRPNEKAQKEV